MSPSAARLLTMWPNHIAGTDGGERRSCPARIQTSLAAFPAMAPLFRSDKERLLMFWRSANGSEIMVALFEQDS